jgi:hypothetical protein
MNNSIPQHLSMEEILLTKRCSSNIQTKEYLDFFGEDEKIELLVKEIAEKQKLKNENITMKDQQNQKFVLQQIKIIKEKLIVKITTSNNTSAKFKFSIKKLTENILKKDQENKKQLLEKERSLGDINLKPLVFPK